MALEGLKLRKPKPKVAEEPKQKFNFNTVRRAEGSVKTPAWLKGVPMTQLVHWWKIAISKKKLTVEETEKLKDVKHILKNKYNVEFPR